MLKHSFPLVVAAAFIIIGARMLIVTRRQRRGTVAATGTVVSLDKSGPLGSMQPSDTGYSPVIRFQTADGRDVHFEPAFRFDATALALFGRRYMPGHQLTVRYQPDNPQRASINGPVINWVIPFGAMAAGVALLAGTTAGVIT